MTTGIPREHHFVRSRPFRLAKGASGRVLHNLVVVSVAIQSFRRDLEWVKASGNAKLHTFGIVHVPPQPRLNGQGAVYHEPSGREILVSASISVILTVAVIVGRIALRSHGDFEYRHGVEDPDSENQRRLHVAEFHAGVGSSLYTLPSSSPLREDEVSKLSFRA